MAVWIHLDVGDDYRIESSAEGSLVPQLTITDREGGAVHQLSPPADIRAALTFLDELALHVGLLRERIIRAHLARTDEEC
jgi:hypothetical protein